MYLICAKSGWQATSNVGRRRRLKKHRRVRVQTQVSRRKENASHPLGGCETAADDTHIWIVKNSVAKITSGTKNIARSKSKQSLLPPAWRVQRNLQTEFKQKLKNKFASRKQDARKMASIPGAWGSGPVSCFLECAVVNFDRPAST